MSSLSPELEPVVRALSDRGEVTLDEIAEALGTRVAGYAEIDTIIDALESAGVRVASPAPGDLPGELSRVLTAARQLSGRGGGVPSVQEIAAETQLDASIVRRTLLYARVLSR